jgi:hypothetical protein
MKGMKEEFNSKRKSRTLNVDSVENTLIPDRENPNAIHKIPVTEEYVFPDWYVDSGILFDTKCDSKRMVTNKKIRDVQAIQSVIQNFMLLLQVDPTLVQGVDVAKLFEQVLKLAEMDTDDIMKNEDESDTGKLLKQIKMAKESILNPPTNVPLQANPQQSSPLGSGQGLPQIPQQTPTAGSLQSL